MSTEPIPEIVLNQADPKQRGQALDELRRNKVGKTEGYSVFGIRQKKQV